MSRRIVSCLSFIVLIGSAGTLHAKPLDPPDVVYIDGVPCNSLCQAYMAWSRKTLAAGSAQHPTASATRQATEVSPTGSRSAARGRFARRTTRPAHDRDTSMASARAAAVSRPKQSEKSKAKAERARSLSIKQAEAPDDRQTEPSNRFQANPPASSQTELPAPSRLIPRTSGKLKRPPPPRRRCRTPLLRSHPAPNSRKHRARGKRSNRASGVRKRRLHSPKRMSLSPPAQEQPESK